MEEYTRLQEEKALSRGETFNWQTATYGKMEYCKDEDDCFTNFKTKFPAIVLDNTLTSDVAILCGPTVSSLNNNEIDFRISYDESDDEDYTVIFDKNSFSYKIIYVNDLKTNSKNDNDKVNMPSFLSLKPEVSYSNDLDFFKDFENEFPAIVYNDALTSKSDFSTKPILNPQHIDEFDLKSETSLSECDEKEQNVLYFNDLLPFNMIYPDDLKSDTDNDNDKIDIEQPSGDMSVIPSPSVINVDTQGSNKLLEISHDTSNKLFKTETFIKNLNVNIMTCNHLSNRMSFIFLIKNLYVSFGIPFDPKLFYKDEINLEKGTIRRILGFGIRRIDPCTVDLAETMIWCRYFVLSETSPDARSWFYRDDDSNEWLRILSEYPDMFAASLARDESKIETQKLFPRPVRVIDKYLMAEGGDLKIE
ncbi:hypothetical protein Tco_0040673 [Tanacetum coccineum]